jgi:hypothetical protein
MIFKRLKAIWRILTAKRFVYVTVDHNDHTYFRYAYSTTHRFGPSNEMVDEEFDLVDSMVFLMRKYSTMLYFQQRLYSEPYPELTPVDESTIRRAYNRVFHPEAIPS